jgi:hypothetical protein
VIEINLHFSNESARATHRELKRILSGDLADKISGDRRDKHDTATAAYERLNALRAFLANHIAKLDDEERKNIRVQPVREKRDYK